MNCMYTAQGALLCKSNAERVVERFFVREDPNEPEANNACAPIQKAFSAIAANNGCDMDTDLDSCTLKFSCRSSNCTPINKRFAEIASANACSVKTNLNNCEFSYQCRAPTK